MKFQLYNSSIFRISLINKKEGPGENRTRIARFRVLSDNHYTTGPSSTLVWKYSLRASRCMSNRRSIGNRPALGFHDFE